MDADAFMGAPSRAAFLAARRLKWVHSPGMGMDPVAMVPEMVESDVVFTNAPGPHTNVMADHVLGVMLSLAHRLGEMRDDQQAKRWDTGKYQHSFVELNGGVLGLLGLGGPGPRHHAAGARLWDAGVCRGPHADGRCPPVCEQSGGWTGSMSYVASPTGWSLRRR